MTVQVSGGSSYGGGYYSYCVSCPSGGSINYLTGKCTGQDYYKIFYHDLTYYCVNGVVTGVYAGGDNPCDTGYTKLWGAMKDSWAYATGDSCSPDVNGAVISGGAPYYRNCVWNGDYPCSTATGYENYYRFTVGVFVQ